MSSTSTPRQIIFAEVLLATLTCNFLFWPCAVFGKSDKTKKLPVKGDRITVVSGATPIPLPAELIEIIKGKATVHMLPSFQYKGGERLTVSLRQIKTVPVEAPEQAKPATSIDKTVPFKLQGNARAGERSKSLSGLFTRFSQTFVGKNLVCREEQFYFYPDGRVYHGVPKEGPASFDWNRAMVQNPELCGNYGIDGDTIIFNWPNKEAVSWTIKRRGVNIELNGLVADKAPLFNGPILSGTYTRQKVKLIDGKSIMSPSTYAFSEGNKVQYCDSDKKDSGKYVLAGNNLTIKFDSGLDFHCFAYPRYLEGRNNKSPEQIYLDGNIYQLLPLQK